MAGHAASGDAVNRQAFRRACGLGVTPGSWPAERSRALIAHMTPLKSADRHEPDGRAEEGERRRLGVHGALGGRRRQLVAQGPSCSNG